MASRMNDCRAWCTNDACAGRVDAFPSLPARRRWPSCHVRTSRQSPSPALQCDKARLPFRQEQTAIPEAVEYALFVRQNVELSDRPYTESLSYRLHRNGCREGKGS